MTCYFKEEPTTFWHCSSHGHHPLHCCTSFLIPFEVFFYTIGPTLGSPLIHSLIIALLRSKFPKVRQCLKWLVFVGAYKFTLCANSGKSWGIPPLRVLETSLQMGLNRQLSRTKQHRNKAHQLRNIIALLQEPQLRTDEN